jgi:TatD DNase family protein
MFDSHCHLQMRAFSRDRLSVWERACKAGLEGAIVIGMDVQTSGQAIEIAEQFSDVYASVGLHPHDAKLLDDEAMRSLRELAGQPEIVAIGETGLDFYRNLSPKEDQFQAFKWQLALAAELDLPIVVHEREARRETFAVLRDWAPGRKASLAKGPIGVMHCFAGDAALAQEYIALGFMISIAGNVTYPNAYRQQSVATDTPLDWLVLETDAPYLPPEGRRGRRNEPSLLRETVDFVAGLRRISHERLAEATTMNARRLFRLDSREAQA